MKLNPLRLTNAFIEPENPENFRNEIRGFVYDILCVAYYRK